MQKDLNAAMLISSPDDRTHKILCMFLSNSVLSPRLSLDVSESWKNLLAVLPSFDVPEPDCFGMSTTNPVSSRKAFCISAFSSCVLACHFFIGNL